MNSNRQELHNLLKKTVKSITVLYLDDEKHNLKSFEANFNRKYEVITAQTEKEALELLKTNKIDVFLTDYNMPKVNGNQMIEKVKKLYPSIKSMIITAYSEGVKANVPVLYKPFNIPEIVNNISILA